MPDTPFNKYRAAIEVLHRGRDVLVNDIANEILDHSDDLIDGGFAFNEFLEGQGTRLHFLCLLVAQLEQSAEVLDESLAPPPPSPKKRRSRAKKLERQPASEESTEDT
jgi:hypothetical protein